MHLRLLLFRSIPYLLGGLFGQHVILFSEQQMALCRRCGVFSSAAGVAHPVQRIVLGNMTSQSG